MNSDYQQDSFETIAYDIYNPDESGFSSFGDHMERYDKIDDLGEGSQLALTESRFSNMLNLSQMTF